MRNLQFSDVCMYVCMYLVQCKKKSPERSQYSEASLHQGPPWTERLFHRIKYNGSDPPAEDQSTVSIFMFVVKMQLFKFNITFPICE